MSLRMEVEYKKEVARQVEAWLSDYEMPVNIYSVISALMSLGYLSSQITRRAADRDLESVGTLLCDECQHPRDVQDYILEKCAQCGDDSHVIVWLDDEHPARRGR